MEVVLVVTEVIKNKMGITEKLLEEEEESVVRKELIAVEEETEW